MRFRTAFPNRHVILPVIHVTSSRQALRNALIARDAGADGIFLINHDIPWKELLLIHRLVMAEHTGWWVGINCLDLAPEDVFRHIDERVAGVWVDNAMIDERVEKQELAEMVLDARRRSAWPGLYFGGVSFKYQRPVDDLSSAVRKAIPYMDVVTTSGPGTGLEASPDKIAVMKDTLGKYPLAIASGITPENIVNYLNNADCFLVATGISKDRVELDATRIDDLLRSIGR